MPIRSILLLILISISLGHISSQEYTAPIQKMLDEADAYHSDGLGLDRTNPNEAISKYQQALNIRNQVFNDFQVRSPKLLEGIIKGYFNISDCNRVLGDYEKMELYLDSCMQVQLTFEEEYGFFSHRRRGQVYQGFGKLNKVVSGFESALEAFQNAHLNFGLVDDKPESWKAFNQGRILNDISALYVRWGIAPDSISYYAKSAIKIYQSLIDQGVGTLAHYEDLSYALINKSIALEIAGDLPKAEQSFREALDMLEETKVLMDEELSEEASNSSSSEFYNYGPFLKNLNMAYLGLATTLRKNKNYPLAKSYLNTSLRINRMMSESSFVAKLARVLEGAASHNLAEVYYDEGKFEEALNANQDALKALLDDIPNLWDQYENPEITRADLVIYDQLYFLEALIGKAKSLEALNQTKAALATADLGIQFIYQIRKKYLDRLSRFQLANGIKELTEIILRIKLSPQNKDITSAFEYVELNKNYNLLEAIRDHKKLKITGVDQDLLEEENLLRQEIEAIENKLFGTADAEEQTSLMAQRREKKNQLSKLIAALNNNENYRRITDGLDPIPVSTIQDQLLAQNQALIEYFVGSQATYVFIIPKEGDIASFKVDIQEDQINQQIDDLLTAILYSYQEKEKFQKGYQSHWTREGLTQSLLQNGQELYLKFLAPVFEHTSASRFILIPDGAFNRLPFSVLIQPNDQTIAGAYHTYDFFGKRHPISYCYAATLLAEMQKKTKSYNQELLAFAPSFEGTGNGSKNGFNQLRFNTEEVDKICDIISCDLPPFTGNNALKSIFLEQINGKQRYNFVHLSTHGKADYNDPDNSFISFTQSSADRVDKTQLFYLRELYNLELAIETLVLSSCETNLGPVHRAGGMLSLTRGFAFAGVKSIISSLWAVNEQSTKEMMVAFYENMETGMEKDVALQKAKLSLQSNSDYNHPYYWAAFIPVGKTSLQKGTNPRLFWIAGSLALALLLLYRRRKTN